MLKEKNTVVELTPEQSNPYLARPDQFELSKLTNRSTDNAARISASTRSCSSAGKWPPTRRTLPTTGRSIPT